MRIIPKKTFSLKDWFNNHIGLVLLVLVVVVPIIIVIRFTHLEDKPFRCFGTYRGSYNGGEVVLSLYTDNTYNIQYPYGHTQGKYSFETKSNAIIFDCDSSYNGFPLGKFVVFRDGTSVVIKNDKGCVLNKYINL